jgi:hypothetical protein
MSAQPAKSLVTFEHTRAALAEYDASKDARGKAWDDFDNDVTELLCMEHDALQYVQEAYYLDTKLINSHYNCMMADLKFMRAMVESENG